MKVVVIIPTYNEKDNICQLIPALLKEFKNISHDMNILVVDDNSPDGTAQVVHNFTNDQHNIALLTGEKAGLGRAYIKGMNYAINNMRADAIIEMDADFSHKPCDLPRLIKELNQYDVVIGSRYVPGGKIPPEWAFTRRLNSKLGNFCARHIAGIHQVNDCTAGFRAIRSSLLKKINLNNLNVNGYSFQINLLHLAVVNHAKIKEIPVEFVDRTEGKSKLGISDVLEFLFQVWTIRLELSKTFMKFTVVGLSGVIVNLGSLTMLLHWDVNKFIASPVSIELSILSNFFLNNFWTFPKYTNQDILKIKGLRFNLVSLISLAVSYSIFILIMQLRPSFNPQLAQAIGIPPAFLLNYFFNSYWTFKSWKRVPG